MEPVWGNWIRRGETVINRHKPLTCCSSATEDLTVSVSQWHWPTHHVPSTQQSSSSSPRHQYSSCNTKFWQGQSRLGGFSAVFLPQNGWQVYTDQAKIWHRKVYGSRVGYGHAASVSVARRCLQFLVRITSVTQIVKHNRSRKLAPHSKLRSFSLYSLHKCLHQQTLIWSNITIGTVGGPSLSSLYQT